MGPAPQSACALAVGGRRGGGGILRVFRARVMESGLGAGGGGRGAGGWGRRGAAGGGDRGVGAAVRVRGGAEPGVARGERLYIQIPDIM
jgi:hypothetical protein